MTGPKDKDTRTKTFGEQFLRAILARLVTFQTFDQSQSDEDTRTDQKFARITMLSNVTLNCHVFKDCQFRFSIIRILISVSNVISLYHYIEEKTFLVNCAPGHDSSYCFVRIFFYAHLFLLIFSPTGNICYLMIKSNTGQHIRNSCNNVL